MSSTTICKISFTALAMFTTAMLLMGVVSMVNSVLSGTMSPIVAFVIMFLSAIVYFAMTCTACTVKKIIDEI